MGKVAALLYIALLTWTSNAQALKIIDFGDDADYENLPGFYPRFPPRNGELFMVVGERIWELVKEGQPKVDVAKIKTLDVLPRLPSQTITAFDLTSWSLPQSSSYRIRVKNGWGKIVVDISYRIFYSYGGTYNGKGAYLTGVAVEPTHVHARWGFNVDMGVEVVSITNLGNRENPLPALTFQIHYHIQSVMSASENRDTYTVIGDGQLIEYD